jgi:serine/threonine protein kinase
MTCPSCSATLEVGARFCGVCGHRLESQPAQPAQPAPPARPVRAAAEPAGPRSMTSREKSRQGGGNKGGGKPKPSSIAVAPAVPATDPYIGTTLNGRFTVEEKLGEGGFGAVYKGGQLQTGRKVAIKLLHPEMTRDQNVVARFRREGQVLCSLRDAHTITTYDFDQTADGTLFIAMELLEGRSLHDIFHDEAPIAWQRMLKIMSEMCSSLEEAHTLGIVHRDLKPENIYLETRPGNPEFVKILDFGIAKVMRGDGSSGIAGDMSPALTATGQTLGTLEYMSPEQLMGKTLDGRSDIYGLGVVTFEMLTGRLPFPEAVGPAALISAQLKKVPPTASKIYPKGGIPPQVDQLILKMLAKDKSARFRDVGELRREIDGILGGGLGAQSANTPPPQLVGPSPPPSRPPTGLAPSPIQDLRRSWSAGATPAPALGGPALAAGMDGPALEPASITARSLSPRPPAAPTRGLRPAAAGSDDAHFDPPWAGGGPAGSAVSPTHPRAPSPGPVGHGHAHAPSTTDGKTPWMWIAVAAILFLAVVLGGFLALR